MSAAAHPSFSAGEILVRSYEKIQRTAGKDEWPTRTSKRVRLKKGERRQERKSAYTEKENSFTRCKRHSRPSFRETGSEHATNHLVLQEEAEKIQNTLTFIRVKAPFNSSIFLFRMFIIAEFDMPEFSPFSLVNTPLSSSSSLMRFCSFWHLKSSASEEWQYERVTYFQCTGLHSHPLKGDITLAYTLYDLRVQGVKSIEKKKAKKEIIGRCKVGDGGRRETQQSTQQDGGKNRMRDRARETESIRASWRECSSTHVIPVGGRT